MSIARIFALTTAASSICAFQQLLAQSGDQASPPVITIINSAAAGLRTPNTALRIVIRDADAPDQPIDQANVVVSPADSAAAGHPPRGVASNDRGIVAAMRLNGGEYTVAVRRIGYYEARFTIHVRSSCEQFLEVYITRSIYQFDRCQVKTTGSPPCDPGPPPTPSRAVLTTCAHAA